MVNVELRISCLGALRDGSDADLRHVPCRTFTIPLSVCLLGQSPLREGYNISCY